MGRCDPNGTRMRIMRKGWTGLRGMLAMAAVKATLQQLVDERAVQLRHRLAGRDTSVRIVATPERMAIDEARRKGHFGADDDEVDTLAQGQAHEAVQILGFDGQALGDLGNAGVSRRAIEFVAAWRAGDRPAEGVFAAP